MCLVQLQAIPSGSHLSCGPPALALVAGPSIPMMALRRVCTPLEVEDTLSDRAHSESPIPTLTATTTTISITTTTSR